MAITRVQQSQISGSLLYSIDPAGAGLANKSSLAGDLDALRSLIKDIKGSDASNWFDAASQDLSDIAAAMDVSGADAEFQQDIRVLRNADVDGTFNADLAATFGSTMGVTGKATLSDELDVAKTVKLAASGYQTEVRGDLKVDEGAEFADVVDFDDAVYMASSLGVSGSMDVAGVSHFAEKVWMASDLGVSGSLAVHALATFDGGVEISGDKLEVTGDVDVIGSHYLHIGGAVAGDGLEKFSVVGASGDIMSKGKFDLDGKATVGSFKSSGTAEFADDVTVDANKKLIVSDLNQYSILLGGGSSEIAQDSKLTFDGSTTFNINTDKFVVTVSSGDASMAGDLTVSGGKISLSHGSTIDSETDGELKLTEDLVYVTGDLRVGGNDIKDSEDAVALTFKSIHSVASSVEIAHNMEIKGGNFYAVSGSFSGDLTVDGDLNVRGKMTYIETENLKVKDSLIHISEGGSASAAKGIVLHNGAPGNDDFALGVKPNGTEFVFASGVSDADTNSGNSNVFGGAQLAAAWMSEMKIASLEGGALAGSLAYNGANIKLASLQDLKLEAATDMMLKSNGHEVGLMEAADYSNVFAAGKWADGGTIVGALETLHSLATAGTRKGTLSSANVDGAHVLDFSSIGTIAAEHKYIDVYLNGVLLAPGYDLDGSSAIESGTTVKLSADIANALIADDVITVVLRAAA